MKSVEEMLRDFEARFVAVVRDEQERRALAALATPDRLQRMRELWQAESPQARPYLGPTCVEALELARIEAEVEREMVDQGDPPYVSPEAEAAWDASYQPGKTPERLPR